MKCSFDWILINTLSTIKSYQPQLLENNPLKSQRGLRLYLIICLTGAKWRIVSSFDMTSIFYGEKLEKLKLAFTNFFPFGSRPFNSQVVFPGEYISVRHVKNVKNGRSSRNHNFVALASFLAIFCQNAKLFSIFHPSCTKFQFL